MNRATLLSARPLSARPLPQALLLALLLAAGVVPDALAAETAMLGNTPSRNMASDQKGLPSTWDTETGLNVLWSEEVGSQSYAGPVIADGRVYVGTNNEDPRDAAITGDKGVLMAFGAKDGKFLWQLVHDKLPDGRVHDWPLQGICSTPYVDGDDVWYVSNRAEVVHADAKGLSESKNDGPFKTEKYTGEGHGDILWSVDMIRELDVFPHNLAAGSPIVIDGILYTVTGNGVDEGHVNVPSPFAPSFLALDAKTGKVVWEDATPGEKILHGSWSNPSYGVIGGKPQVIFPGGDGWLYSFEPKTGKLLWKFDCNPKDSKWELGGSGTRNNIIGMPVIYKDRVYVTVGQDPEHGEGLGHLWAIDATLAGDVTGKGVVWHRGGEDFHRSMSTAAIQDGIVYISDLSGFLYALDAETGQLYWKYDAFAAIWGSPYVADGRVYLGDEDGDVAILATGKTLKVLGEINMGHAVYASPAAHDGVLYVLSRKRLWALKDGIAAKPVEGAEGAKAAAR